MYKGRSIGRLINFLNEYCGVRIAYEVIFDNFKIEFHGQPFATYRWDGDTNIPTFNFLGDHLDYERIQERLKEATVKMLKEGETVHDKEGEEIAQ